MPHDRDEQVAAAVLQAGRLIDRFVGGDAVAAVLQEDLRRSAILFQLIVLGEASGNAGVGLRAALPEVDWTGWRGLRNLIAHRHHTLRTRDLVLTLSDELPEAIARISLHLERRSG